MDQSMMSQHQHQESTSPNQSFPQDMFPLDFLSFVESSSPSQILNGMTDFSLPSPGSNSHQPQNHPTQPLGDGGDGLRSIMGFSPPEAPPSRGGSSKGRSRSRAAPKKASSSVQGGKRGHQSFQNGMNGMEVDQERGDAGMGQLSPDEMQRRISEVYGINGMEDFEAFMESQAGQIPGISQGMLQQFEGIHMRSPIVFDPSNPSQPYNPMAQFLASSPHLSGDGHHKGNSIHLLNGLITPGASTEMYAQTQAEQTMSPMQLEMLRRDMDNMPDLGMPLHSPALNNYNPNSSHPSPAAYPVFPPPQSPLEALQEQQRQFQDQLNALQVQQRQLQATAAAVAASQSSSSTFASSGSSTHSMLVNTPAMQGSTETSPQYFTPLTSPALEATRQYHNFSAGNGRPMHPHPLSALSSPALNPLGSAGGAQQTLSPALLPQNNSELSDPDYIRALVGMFDVPPPSGPSNPTNYQHMDPQLRRTNGDGPLPYLSPSLGGQSYAFGSQSSHQHSPLTPNHTGHTPMMGPSSSSLSATGSGSSNGITTGPHRQSLPAKSRPSPLVKPVNHRSHIRHPSTHQSFSQPSSPHVLKGIQPGTYLPAAAMNEKYGNSGREGSMTSTPSPVDLTSMMPPPPVPAPNPHKGLTPMTPAALMNLGSGSGSGGRRLVLPRVDTTSVATGSGSQKPLSKKAAAALAASTSNGTAPGAAGTPVTAVNTKKGKVTTGKKVNGKGGVGVRAATKGAAAAAQAQSQPEPENRRTSHKAAEQKRRDSLKAGFDELRLLLPPINTEALDPESGEPIPGSSAPRLLPKSSLVPDDNPNRGVSKVALLKFSNEYIEKLHEKVEKREEYIEKLRMEVRRMRMKSESGVGAEEVKMDDGVDLLEYDVREGEDEDEDETLDGDEEDEEGEDEEVDDDHDMDGDEDGSEEMENIVEPTTSAKGKKGANGGIGRKGSVSGIVGKRPSVGRSASSGGTVTPRARRGE